MTAFTGINPQIIHCSPVEYLRSDREAEGKNEYYNGMMVQMPGASMGHNRIVANLLRDLGSALKGKAFDVFPSDFRVASPDFDTFVYPDLSIVSGSPALQDDRFDTLLNPAVIFEVMSAYSRDRDMGNKFFRYQRIHSLREYILIDSRECFIQKCRREEDNLWRFERIGDINGSLFINTTESRLAVADIYYRVSFSK